MLNVFALVLVLAAGLYLVGLAAVAFVSPQRARLFLSSLASSAAAHFVELSVRLVMGAALVLYAPRMMFSSVFVVFGWVVVVTTLGLLVLPWRWHQRFAKRSVPYVIRNMALFATGSLAAGVLLLLSVVCGPGFEQWRIAIVSSSG